MWKHALLGLAIGVVYCGPTNAQGNAGLLKGLQANKDTENQRKDVEGFIWEYKVIEPDERDRSKRTRMTGRLRIKETALFAVGKVEFTTNNDEEQKDESKAPTKTSLLLAQRETSESVCRISSHQLRARKAKASRNKLRALSPRGSSNRARSRQARRELAT